jgi:hypothetical protein
MTGNALPTILLVALVVIGMICLNIYFGSGVEFY